MEFTNLYWYSTITRNSVMYLSLVIKHLTLVIKMLRTTVLRNIACHLPYCTHTDVFVIGYDSIVFKNHRTRHLHISYLAFIHTWAFLYGHAFSWKKLWCNFLSFDDTKANRFIAWTHSKHMVGRGFREIFYGLWRLNVLVKRVDM